MKSFKLDPITHKLLIPFKFVEGQDKVRQDLQVHLRTFYEENFLNKSKGIKYKELILDKIDKNKLKEIEAHLKSEILTVRDVLSIVSYTQKVNYNDSNIPELEVYFTVNTSFGLITLTENLTA